MTVHPETAAMRTMALMGPTAAGKTLLAETLLWKAGVIGAPGSLERGSTISDFDPLERRAQHSLNSSALHLMHDDTRVHLIDTPGALEGVGHALAALEAVETAALVINATAGLESAGRRMMQAAAERGLTRLVIVNKIDAPGTDLPRLLASLQEAFGNVCVPLNLPCGGGRDVVDCFFNKTAPPGREADFSSVEATHRALVEQVVEVDADFVERYLNDGDVDPSELHAPLEQALREGHLIPVCFVSARQAIGITELLDVIVRLLPHPGEGNAPHFLRGEGAAAVPVQAQPDATRPVLAHVFKITQDPYVGKLGIFRVHQGTVTRDSTLYIGDSRKAFKLGHLFRLQGKEHVEISRAVPGDICAVAKIEELSFDAVLHDAPEDSHVRLEPPNFPLPVHGLAIEPKRRGDEQRLWDLLRRLVDEDPCLKLEHDAQTNQTIVYGLGERHLRTLLDRLGELHHCEVDTHVPRIAYRETITASAEGHHRHKKQTGGAGQFGEVFLRVEPLPRGAGIEFIDEVKGGAIPGVFMPAVEKGVRQALDAGVIAGHRVTDVRVVVHDGKHHSVDSKEIAFVTAGRKAVIDAVKQARPIVLEPIVDVEIMAPEGHIGDITGDLCSRRGQVSGTRHDGADAMAGGLAVLGQAPLVELSAYQSRLNAMTGGQGRYTLAFSHYEPLPPALQAQLVADHRVRDDY